MDDFNEYVPGQAYANLKDEMVSEYTLGQPRLPTGTTTYKSGATSTTTATPYGYHLQMRGPKSAVQSPTVTPREEFAAATEFYSSLTPEESERLADALRPVIATDDLIQATPADPVELVTDPEGETVVPRAERTQGL